MSNNGYSLRERGGSYSDRPEKKQRFDSTSNYADATSPYSTGQVPQSILNASSVLYVGGFPPDWTENIVESVVAGSGRIVDIRSRLDPGGRKNFCFVEYESPQEAEKALELLAEVTLGPRRKLRVELSKEGLRTSRGAEKKIRTLDRKFLPQYVNMPPAMKNNTEFVLNHDIAQHIDFQSQSTPTPIVGASLAPEIPEVLSKASKYLPQFNQDAFKSEDKISENLQTIPPAQMIELLSTLKNLLSKNDYTSSQQVFNMAPTIPIAVSQALILMGLIDVNMLTTGLQTASNNTTPQPQAAIPSFAPQQAQPPMFQSHPSATVPLQQHPQMQPGWESFSYQTIDKLAKLDANEATMIVQVLKLTPQDISRIPQEQMAVVNSIRSQYL